MIGGLESIETDFIEQIQRTRGRHTSRYAASFKRHFHVLLNGEPWKQGKTLKDDCRMWIHAAKRLATVKHAALTRCGQARDNAQECTFAASRWPEERDELAFVHAKTHVLNGDELALPCAITLRDVFELHNTSRRTRMRASGSLLRVVKRLGQMTELVGLRRGKLYYPFLG